MARSNRLTGGRRKYYAISDVVRITGVKAPTLRNWERTYPELKKVKRINNRRTYTYNDIEFIIQKAKESNLKVKRPSESPSVEEKKTDISSRPVDLTDQSDETTVSEKPKLDKEKIASIRKQIQEVRKTLNQIKSRLD